MSQKKALVLFGGRSAEHEVSVVSAKYVMSVMSNKKYHVLPVGISKSGKWYFLDSLDELQKIKPFESFDLKGIGTEVTLVPTESKVKLIRLSDGEKISEVDVVFPVLHGPFGEDGTIQGQLKFMDVPFVGCDVLGSSVSMDKDIMKRLLTHSGIKNADYELVRKSELNGLSDARLVEIERLGYPLFVKPANMGSSVGVSKVNSRSQLLPAIKDAMKYDRKVLVEEAIVGREIEVSVLGNDDVKVSIPGEIHATHEFYSYEAKYLDDKGATFDIPAKVTEKELIDIQKTAVAAYKALDCEGLARVDVFLTQQSEVYVNELNTMPGFTMISMYPKMWEASGIEGAELVDTLIDLAIERHKALSELSTDR